MALCQAPEASEHTRKSLFAAKEIQDLGNTSQE
jgi:hypothetical protein